MIITRSTVTLVNGKEQKNIIEIYNEPINTFDLIKKIESIIKDSLKAGEFEISADNVKQFFS